MAFPMGTGIGWQDKLKWTGIVLAGRRDKIHAMTTPPSPTLLSPSQAAKMFVLNGKHISVRTIWRWMDSGKLKWSRLGGRRAISLTDIDALKKSWNGGTLSIEDRIIAAKRNLAKYGL